MSKTLSNTWFIFIFIITVLTIGFLSQYRSLEEIIKYTVFIAVPLTIIVVTVMLYYGFIYGFSRRHLWAIVIVPLWALAFSLTFYALIVCIKELYLLTISLSLTNNFIIASLVVITLILGIILFWFRLKCRAIYGFTEVVFGLIIAGNKILETANLNVLNYDFLLAFITASVFLVVRGLDNMHQGLNNEPIDFTAKKIIKFLTLSKG